MQLCHSVKYYKLGFMELNWKELEKYMWFFMLILSTFLKIINFLAVYCFKNKTRKKFAIIIANNVIIIIIAIIIANNVTLRLEQFSCAYNLRHKKHNLSYK
jgi:hypothetical protein